MSDHLTMGRGHDNTSRVTASWLPVHRLPGCIIIAFLLASVIHEDSHYKCIICACNQLYMVKMTFLAPTDHCYRSRMSVTDVEADTNVDGQVVLASA